LSRSDEKRLKDIFTAAAHAELVVARGKTTFDSDVIVQHGLAMVLIWIGESARALSETTRASYPDVNWSDLIGLRNVLARQYHQADPDLLWEIAVRDVPDIVKQLRRGEDPSAE
jgi:uncharacterized protein with HEPN domain